MTQIPAGVDTYDLLAGLPVPAPAKDPESSCPGHVASAADAKVCHHCGTHIDSLRPPEDEAL